MFRKIFHYFMLSSLALGSAVGFSGESDRARRLFWRVAHSEPTAAELQSIIAQLRANNVKQAIQESMNSRTFYSRSLVRYFMPSSNSDGNPMASFNDAVALQLGLVRDDIDFREALYGNRYYSGRDGLVNPNFPADAPANNLHFEAIENSLGTVDLRNTTDFREMTQNNPTNHPIFRGIAAGTTPDVAGVITTRAFGAAFFQAGTNRRMFEYLLKNFLCHTLEEVKDSTVFDQKIRRDVSRAPAGDRQQFETNCKGCHALQDPISGAFAYFDFLNAGRVNYSRARVAEKVTRNADVFPVGPALVHQDDSWENVFETSQSEVARKRLGWREVDGHSYRSGNGAKSLGRALSNTQAFSSCQAQRVFEHLCQRAAGVSDRISLKGAVKEFEESGYKMKKLFESVGALCL